MSSLPISPDSSAGTIGGRIVWGGLGLLCLTFGGFSLWMGNVEVLSLAGLVDEVKERVDPLIFTAHALAGGAALIAGVLQFSRHLRRSRPHLHRVVGRLYIGGAWAASFSGLWSALFFDISIPARIAFSVGALLWFTATTVGLVMIRRGNVPRHQEWMTRSFALALFFVTFEPWVVALEAAGLDHAVGYPLGIFLAWFVNLAVAEWRLRELRQPPEIAPKVELGAQHA